MTLNLYHRFTLDDISSPVHGVWIKGCEHTLPCRFAEARFQAIFAQLKALKRPVKVLDLGSGGYLSFRLAERLEGTFILVEGHPVRTMQLAELVQKNSNPQIIQLFFPFYLQALDRFLRSEPVDAILAIGILHFFEHPWKDVIDVLTQHCSRLFLEHLHPYEAAAPIRVAQEPLDLSPYIVEELGSFPTPKPLELRRRALLQIQRKDHSVAAQPGIALSHYRTFGGIYPPLKKAWLRGKEASCRVVRGKILSPLT
jgi:hypothetical protein